MPGDYTRVTFKPFEDHLGVLMQQGRVLLDADYNEMVEILGRRLHAGTMDIIGRCAVPKETPDGFLIKISGTTITIGRGRIYVDGLLAENHGKAPLEFDPSLAELRGTLPVPYNEQPYFPNASTVLPFPTSGGPYLVYVDVWQREITHLEEPDLIEKAVGVDTATRLQTVWQVKWLQVASGVTCATPSDQIPPYVEATRPSAGRLTTAAVGAPKSTDPCIVNPTGGFRGTENRLYRVEVHAPGPLGTATFKWSRDNGSVATSVLAVNAGRDELTVARTARDAVLRFSTDDWVEVTDDWHELAGQPGVMRKVKTVDDVTGKITLLSALPAGDFDTANPQSRHTRIQRWDQKGLVRDAANAVLADVDAGGGVIPVLAAGSPVLEDGVQVTFGDSPDGGDFHTGDFWVFAARTVDASVEPLTEAPPRGIHHHYCRLAVVTFPNDVLDCRPMWPDFGCCCCTVEVGDGKQTHGDFDSLPAAVEALSTSQWNPGGVWIPAVICLLPGTHQLTSAVTIQRDRITIRGCGRLAHVVGPSGGAGGTAFRFEGSHGALEEVYLTSTGGAPAVVWTGQEGRLHRCEIETGGGAAVASLRNLGLRILGCRLSSAAVPGAAGGASSGLIDLGSETQGVQVIGNHIGPGPGHGILLSSGDLRDLLIAGNEIREMHGCGITNVLTKPVDEIDLDQIGFDKVNVLFMVAFVLQRVDELRIEHNTIAGCVGPGRLPPGSKPEVPDGGIVLRRLSHVQISDNRIEDNGTDLGVSSPVAGIYIRDCKGLVIRDNVIIDNGLPPDGESIPGLQGGILAEELSVVVELVALDLDEDDEEDRRLAPLQPDGWPAAAVQGNLVEAPRGLALLLAGMGPMQVTGNLLTSRDVLFKLGDKSPSVYSLFGTVVIFNLGLPAYAIAQLLGLGFLLANSPDILTDKLDLLTVGGKVDFSNNQVVLNQIRGEVELAVAAVGILTLDDLALHDNQTECTQLIDFLLIDTLAIATTLRATGNGFTESLFTTAISLWAAGFLMCTGTSNQGTHCIIVECLTSKLRDEHNLDLVCREEFAGFRLFPRRSAVEGTDRIISIRD